MLQKLCHKFRFSLVLLLKRGWGDRRRRIHNQSAQADFVCLAASIRRVFSPLAIALSLAIILYLSSPAPSAPFTQQNEIRGVWLTNIDSDVLFERKRLSQAIQTLHQLNFNTIYPTIWNWGYTLYPSQVAAKAIGRSLDPASGLQGRDILQEIVQQGHQQLRMGVIPWFEFGFMAPADSQLAKRHPQWLTRRRNNNQIWLEGKHKRVWLNPFHPEVQQFMQNLILEIVTKYDIDGIQFDDHFGLPSEFGYDPFTINLYKQEHNGNPPP